MSQVLEVSSIGSVKYWKWQVLEVASIGSGKYWKWQVLEVASIGSGKYWKWQALEVAYVPDKVCYRCENFAIKIAPPLYEKPRAVCIDTVCMFQWFDVCIMFANNHTL